MGSIREYQKEKLFAGIFFFDRKILNQVLENLVQKWGENDYVSDPIDFTQYSTYYNDEMGTTAVSKMFVSFKSLIIPNMLSEIKLWTNLEEKKFAIEGKRQINIDPGLLSLGHIVLPTTKNAGHKIALDRGIYADLNLIYEKKAFRPLPWTYPDFRSSYVQSVLEDIRTIYKKQLKFES